MRNLPAPLTLILAAFILFGCVTAPSRTQAVPAAPAEQATPTNKSASALEPSIYPAYTPATPMPYPFPQEVFNSTTMPEGSNPYPFPSGLATDTQVPPRAEMPYPYPLAPTPAPLESTESTFLPHLYPTITPDYRLTPTPTFFVTPLPVLPEVSKWYTFTYGAVSIQYPSDWMAHQIGGGVPEHIGFKLDQPIDVSRFYWIDFDIYDHEGNDIPNPHSSEPNEGGYAVQWERPLSIDNLPGVEFVWGAYQGNGQWDSLPTLDAWLYYASKKLDIRLTVAFDKQTIDQALAEGYQNVIDETYVVFHHMLQSVRVTP